jgi:hypothetical protein
MLLKSVWQGNISLVFALLIKSKLCILLAIKEELASRSVYYNWYLDLCIIILFVLAAYVTMILANYRLFWFFIAWCENYFCFASNSEIPGKTSPVKK